MGDILRELYPTEYFYDLKIKKGKLINAKTFIVETSFNLYTQIDNVKKSILHWIYLHPCLSVLIKEFQIDCESKFFYVKATDDQINSLKNVDFLRFKINDEICSNLDDIYWHLILRHELTHKFQSTDLLWRLIILQLSEFRYAFTINLHHGISDGPNSFAIIQELLGLIEKQIFFSIPVPNEQRLGHSSYEINFPNDPRKPSEMSKLEPIAFESRISLILPECFKSNKTNIEDESLINGIYETIDGDFYSDVKNLFQKSLDSNTGHNKMKISDEIFKEFIQVCKEKRVKLNGVFELIVCLAFRKLYKFYELNQVDNLIKYQVMINARSFLVPPLPNYVMNAWVKMFMTELEEVLDEDSEDFWSKFWTQAQKNTLNLHSCLESFRKRSPFKPDEMMTAIEMERQDFYYLDAYSHFCITNIGDQKMFIESNGMLKIKEYYTGVSYSPKCSFNIGVLGTCSIDSSSYWTFSYNKTLLNNFSAQKVLDFIYEYVKKVSGLEKHEIKSNVGF
ncbi:unnamed protein product [Brachionus calyciflorus]|uniref:Alcohol acetyltransferase n=1 Tax=Brachionus calyciflorus TaxID=104777 RepID=A0A814NCY6_9BILA|nr:unnamed protein product [Brachionus calyciflorus]